MSLRIRRHRSVAEGTGHASPPAQASAHGRAFFCAAVALAAVVAGSAALPAASEASLALRPAVAAQVPTLSNRVRTSEDPDALRNEIDTFLDFHVGRLFSDDPAAVSQSRQMLADAVSDPASSAFRRLYAELLIERLNRRISNAETFNQLNAAIVVEKVVRLTQNLRFGPLITRLAQDDDAAVAIWAAKAAYPIFPELLGTLGDRDRQALVKALAESVQRFPDNGALAEEVYRTLAMRTTEMRPPAQAVLVAGAPAIVPAIHDLIAFRVKQYRPNAPAPDPMAELPGLVVLTNTFIWPAQPAAQQQRTVAVLRDLMLQLTVTANNLPQQGQERRDLVDIIKRVGSAFEGISGPVQANGEPVMPQVFTAAQVVRRLGQVPSPAALSAATGGLSQALTAAFPGLPAPQLSNQTPAEEDEEDSTTGPSTVPEDE